MKIRWDPSKASAKVAAHGVTFTEAATVLDDEAALTREHPDATAEQRFATLGLSDQGRLLVVACAHRDPDVIRIISAWKAGRQQRRRYEEGGG